MKDIDLLDLLVRVNELLDQYVDVNDGDDGRPRPNRAMSLYSEIDAIILRLHSAVEKGQLS